ncbi:hypothetical protein FNV43_RR24621 [Rhamnella rubrinervis]|uniref:Uncharacterized protein n=1 Tax=Rhamnella rubrinervis TaxID=2594499 RepID=A0A8K0DSX5_9ROSA|nr:hypothetical protein FNV43_RR24621 [Rhamnella rubrinervis]
MSTKRNTSSKDPNSLFIVDLIYPLCESFMVRFDFPEDYEIDLGLFGNHTSTSISQPPYLLLSHLSSHCWDIIPSELPVLKKLDLIKAELALAIRMFFVPPKVSQLVETLGFGGLEERARFNSILTPFSWGGVSGDFIMHLNIQTCLEEGEVVSSDFIYVTLETCKVVISDDLHCRIKDLDSCQAFVPSDRDTQAMATTCLEENPEEDPKEDPEKDLKEDPKEESELADAEIEISENE